MSKRKAVSLEYNYLAIKQLENKEISQKEIAEKLGVSKSAISGWMSTEQSKKIRDAYEMITVFYDICLTLI